MLSRLWQPTATARADLTRSGGAGVKPISDADTASFLLCSDADLIDRETARLLSERRATLDAALRDADRVQRERVIPARRALVDAIRQALDAGATQVEVARHLGVTRGRVWQWLHQYDGPSG